MFSKLQFLLIVLILNHVCSADSDEKIVEKSTKKFPNIIEGTGSLRGFEKFMRLKADDNVNNVVQLRDAGASPTATLSPAEKLLAKVVPENLDNVRGQTASLWPKGIVPYVVDVESYDDLFVERLKEAMGLVEVISCIQFSMTMSKPTGRNYLHFTNPDKKRECAHETTPGEDGEIIVVMGYDCLESHQVLHTVMHALGFKDEVTHPQRDGYIRVLWDNIQPKYRHLFSIQHEDVPYKVVEYDPMSVMHFNDRAFSANGGPTTAPLISGLQISPSPNLSQLDIMKLRLSFGHECNKRNVEDLLETCKSSFTQGNQGSNEIVIADDEQPSKEKLKEPVTQDDEDIAEVTPEITQMQFGSVNGK